MKELKETLKLRIELTAIGIETLAKEFEEATGLQVLDIKIRKSEDKYKAHLAFTEAPGK